MAEVNNFEEPFQNNIPAPRTNNIPEFYQNNFQNQANKSTPYQNNTLRPNNIPEPYHNNFPEPFQNNNQGPFQNNINQEIANDELNAKMKSIKTTFLTILVIIFISEIVVDFAALKTFTEPKPHDDPDASYFGEGLAGFIILIFFYPILIILESIILCLPCHQDLSYY